MNLAEIRPLATLVRWKVSERCSRLGNGLVQVPQAPQGSQTGCRSLRMSFGGAFRQQIAAGLCSLRRQRRRCQSGLTGLTRTHREGIEHRGHFWRWRSWLRWVPDLTARPCRHRNASKRKYCTNGQRALIVRTGVYPRVLILLRPAQVGDFMASAPAKTSDTALAEL